MSNRTRIVASAAAGAIAIGGGAVVMLGLADPASADVLSSSASAADATAGIAGKDGDDVNWHRVCLRVPVALARVQAVQTRFDADANTPGSIAYLQVRIDKAKAAGKSDVVLLLTDRLRVRKDLNAIIPDRLTQLKDAQALCAKHSAAPAPAPSATGPA